MSQVVNPLKAMLLKSNIRLAQEPVIDDVIRSPTRVLSERAVPKAGVDFATIVQGEQEAAKQRIKDEHFETMRASHEQQMRDDEALREQMDSDYDPPPKYDGSKELVIQHVPAIYSAFDEADVVDESYEDFEYEDFTEREEGDFYDDIMGGQTITLDPSQEAAVRQLSQVQYGCLIGAAGTGKTTTTRSLLNTLINGDAAYGIDPLRLSRVNLRSYHDSSAEAGEEGEAVKDLIPSIAFCAYTGQATQVIKKAMPGSWQKNVFTIHSLLGFAPVKYTKADGKEGMRFEPSYDKLRKMPWDVIFVDEASMVAVELWHMMLDAMKTGCRVYFIGDLNQLPPPVGQGILGFALNRWTVCELTQVWRSSDDSENKILDAAHAVLHGKMIDFEDPKLVPNWRVIGFKLPHDTAEAYKQIVMIAKGLSSKFMPDGDRVYDPWRDRIMTTMNGFDENSSGSLVGQHPINDALSQIFADPDEPRVIIDAKRETKKFAVGYRVMATKNESPAEVNRVTNGLTGKIIEIQENAKWYGDRRLVGNEQDVMANRKLMLEEAMAHRNDSALDRAAAASSALDNFTFDSQEPSEAESEERNGGPASHVVTVKFDNGALRNYSMNAQVEQLRIAYASTTHKAQGAEMPTAIVVVHHASRMMLCRENLYTAVTRASKRVVILYSEHGLRIALATQKISGVTLKQKLVQYQRLMGEEGGGSGFKIMNVRLTEKDR